MSNQIDPISTANAATKVGGTMAMSSPFVAWLGHNSEFVSLVIGGIGLVIAIGGFWYQHRRDVRDREYHKKRMQLLDKQLGE